MTEDELAALERWLAGTAADERSYLEEEAIPALVAEVRRLHLALWTALNALEDGRQVLDRGCFALDDGIAQTRAALGVEAS